MVLSIRGREVEVFPSSLDDLFDTYGDLCENNLKLTSTEHVSMGRDKVLFIKQRQQATSDYRENTKVRWIGSHAALTCHICVMRHKISGVGSIGHFDNFCCWQFGEGSSAHKDGIQIMLDEIDYLSKAEGGATDGLVEVTVLGGYEDERGDAAKNSMSLLRALHEVDPVLDIVHFCVGKFNTIEDLSNAKVGPHLRFGPKTAILKGVALDLKTQILFPAIFDWCQFSDFDTQIKDKMRQRMGEMPLDSEEQHKTADSTFKPKSLKNKSSRSKVHPDVDSHKRRHRKEGFSLFKELQEGKRTKKLAGLVYGLEESES